MPNGGQFVAANVGPQTAYDVDIFEIGMKFEFQCQLDRPLALVIVDQNFVNEGERAPVNGPGQPDGDFVTLDETANALHQVLASLRSPENPTGREFSRIGLVGHSNGSLTSIYATGTYHDADALVTTAWMHVPHPLPFNPGDILAALTTPYIPATAFSKVSP